MEYEAEDYEPYEPATLSAMRIFGILGIIATTGAYISLHILATRRRKRLNAQARKDEASSTSESDGSPHSTHVIVDRDATSPNDADAPVGNQQHSELSSVDYYLKENEEDDMRPRPEDTSSTASIQNIDPDMGIVLPLPTGSVLRDFLSVSSSSASCDDSKQAAFPHEIQIPHGNEIKDFLYFY
jgi:hypothetical protein